MWRGPVVAGRKAAQDAAKGKVIAVHAKLIALAARSGGNPEDNPALRDVIEKARKDSVSKDVIDRAIKRWTGEDKEGAQILEIMYEGYGAGGVAIIAKCLTDNKNRTAANMRSVFSKNGGNLWETGSISNHVFSLQGVIEAPSTWEEIEMAIMESGADDYEQCGDGYKIMCAREDLWAVRASLEDQGVQISNFWLEYIPLNQLEVDDFDQALKLVKLLEDLGSDEDVEKFWTNGVIDDILQEEVEDFIDKHTFQT